MQLQMKFNPREDRILMRINSDREEEFRFWLTRRFVERLIPMLNQEIQRGAAVRVDTDPSSRRHAVAFAHEHSVAQGDFTTPFREAAREYPLGETPLLAGRSALKRNERGGLVLDIAPLDSQGVSLTITPEILHIICALLSKALKQAGWGLSLDIQDDASDDVPQAVSFN